MNQLFFRLQYYLLSVTQQGLSAWALVQYSRRWKEISFKSHYLTCAIVPVEHQGWIGWTLLSLAVVSEGVPTLVSKHLHPDLCWFIGTDSEKTHLCTLKEINTSQRWICRTCNAFWKPLTCRQMHNLDTHLWSIRSIRSWDPWFSRTANFSLWMKKQWMGCKHKQALKHWESWLRKGKVSSTWGGNMMTTLLVTASLSIGKVLLQYKF